MTMIQINIVEAKIPLSETVERVQRGESAMIRKRNTPVAELRPVPARPVTPRTFGGYKGQMRIHPALYDSLPEDELLLWEGQDGQIR